MYYYSMYSYYKLAFIFIFSFHLQFSYFSTSTSTYFCYFPRQHFKIFVFHLLFIFYFNYWKQFLIILDLVLVKTLVKIYLNNQRTLSYTEYWFSLEKDHKTSQNDKVFRIPNSQIRTH